MWYGYIILSEKPGTFYKGYTTDYNQRLIQRTTIVNQGALLVNDRGS